MPIEYTRNNVYNVITVKENKQQQPEKEVTRLHSRKRPILQTISL